VNAPRAVRRPHVLRAHGDERVDDWYWLRDRDDPDVRAYLEAENAYTEAQTANTEALRKQLLEEIVNRVQETDVSAPVRKGRYEYFTRTFEGRQYGIHCRAATGASGGERRELASERAPAGWPIPFWMARPGSWGPRRKLCFRWGQACERR
jgi:protease II